MRHIFDLSGQGGGGFEFFPGAVAAFRIPDILGNSLALLVWGVIVLEPEEEHPQLCQLLPTSVREHLPTSLYHAGWGTLTFENVDSGEITLFPYTPTFHLEELRLLEDDKKQPVRLSRKWQGTDTLDSFEYVFAFVLEQPLGYVTLKLRASGSVTLSVDSQAFVTMDQLNRFPEQYLHDITRTRQLKEMGQGPPTSCPNRRVPNR